MRRVERGGTAVALVLAVCAALAGGEPARAQALVLQDEEIHILTNGSNVSSRLGIASLELGGFHSGAGSILVKAGMDKVYFEVDSINSITSVSDELYVRNDTGVSTIRLDGAFGNLSLGGDGNDGDIVLKDNNFNTTVSIDGDSGNARTSLDGNGFVKGWARIDSDGTVLSCYNCDPSKTVLVAPDVYLVDFSPVSSDISSRPALVTINGPEGPVVSTVPDLTLPSRVRVQPSAATAFTVMIF